MHSKIVLCEPSDRGYFVYDSTGFAISRLAKNSPELWSMALEMPVRYYIEKFRMPQPRRAIEDDEVRLNCNTFGELIAEIAAAS